ncbi:MAG TPA: CHRD domain-containing protein [Burkholderiales bacterium]|nr:CHRD domain-containing protein [Burkholderiales bacterium]
MNWTHILSKRSLIFAAALALAGCAAMGDRAVQVRLTGDEQNPPVRTSATGTATATVGEDRSVTAKITTQGIAGVAAHIHEGAAGSNGPVIVPMSKTGDNEWSTAAGAKFTESQYEAYKAGRTYFNVHSAANKGGEIRGQIRPSGGGSSSRGTY